MNNINKYIKRAVIDVEYFMNSQVMKSKDKNNNDNDNINTINK